MFQNGRRAECVGFSHRERWIVAHLGVGPASDNGALTVWASCGGLEARPLQPWHAAFIYCF